jgi:enoyl-CoA hydratase/carnithine racemase
VTVERHTVAVMSYETVLYDVRDGVATVTLNRPEKLNAWTTLLGAELGDAMSTADQDDTVRAVIVTGAGRAFCAGADLSGGGFGGGSAPKLRTCWPYQVRKPVIAAINGHAVGVGLTYPMTCDVRYVAADAKLAFAFVRRGALPELSSHAIVPRVAGFAVAAELLLSGRTFSGAEAAELGLVTKALPAAEVLPAALALAADIAANTAPVSVAVAKRLLWEGMDKSVAEMSALENRLFPKVTGLPDAREGIAAFVEKRAPVWTGRITTDGPD